MPPEWDWTAQESEDRQICLKIVRFGKLFTPWLSIGYSGGPQKASSRGVPSKDKCLGQKNNMKVNRMKTLSQASSFILSMGKASGLFKKQVKLLTFQLRLLRGRLDENTGGPSHPSRKQMPQKAILMVWNSQKQKKERSSRNIQNLTYFN